MLKYEVYAPYRPVIGGFAWLELQHQSSAAWLVEHTPTQTCRFKSQSQISKTSNLTENYIQTKKLRYVNKKTKLLYASTGLVFPPSRWNGRQDTVRQQQRLRWFRIHQLPNRLTSCGEERSAGFFEETVALRTIRLRRWLVSNCPEGFSGVTDRVKTWNIHVKQQICVYINITIGYYRPYRRLCICIYMCVCVWVCVCIVSTKNMLGKISTFSASKPLLFILDAFTSSLGQLKHGWGRYSMAWYHVFWIWCVPKNVKNIAKGFRK